MRITRFLQYRYLPGLLILLCALATGLAICKDYGVSWDEGTQRAIGDINLRYIRTGDEKGMEGFVDKDHGAAFEVPLKWIEEVISPREAGTVTFIRHLCSYLFFLLGVWCAYLLALRLFREQWIALLGMALLLLQPRIFAHAFFNSKDVPFLSAVLILLYAATVAFEGRKGYQYLLAGAACGYATGIRTMGILFAVLVLAVLFTSLFSKAERRRTLSHLLLFMLGTMAMLYLGWPYLWRHPIDNLLSSYRNLAHFTRWGGSLLFNGKVYRGSALPPYYIPEWFCISTPLCWLLLALGGGTALLLQLKNPIQLLSTVKGKMLLLCIAGFIIPVAAVILLHSVLYDDWRHLYFIYAPFVVIALYGAEQIARRKRGKALVLAAASVQAALTLGFMVSAHPFQQVYFNTLVPHSPEYLRRHFDYEYWGTSYKQGLEYILAHDSRDSIPVVNTGTPVADNRSILKPEGRRRIHLVSEQEGAYLMSTFRWHTEDFPFPQVYGIKVGGSTALQIYRVDTAWGKK